MGRFLVHMHHGGDNCFPGLVLLKEAERFSKVAPDFGQFLAFEELRCGGEHYFHHPDAVRSGAAAGSLNLILGLRPIPAGWLDQVEVVLATGAVNIRVAGVLFFGALIMGLDVGYFRPLVLGKAHDGVLCLAQV